MAFWVPKRPWTPYVITRKLRSFAFSPDNAVHFLYGAVLHRPGERPWPTYVITRNFAVSHLLLKMRCIFFTEQPYTDQGAPLDPLCNHPKLCSFAPAPKNAAHFLYGEALHRPGGTPGPPYAVPSLFEIGVLISEFSVS